MGNWSRNDILTLVGVIIGSLGLLSVREIYDFVFGSKEDSRTLKFFRLVAAFLVAIVIWLGVSRVLHSLDAFRDSKKTGPTTNPGVHPTPPKPQPVSPRPQTPQPPPYDLSGRWFAAAFQMEISIQQTGDEVVATVVSAKVVPRGQVEFHGRFDANPFPALEACYGADPTKPTWVHVNLKVIDRDHIWEELADTGCSGFPVMWQRGF